MTKMMMTAESKLNGVQVEKLAQTVAAIQGNPSLAKFQFRAVNRWMDGGHNRSTIQGFYGAGQEDTTRTAPFVLDADEPAVLLGADHGANPVEYVLHALAACLTTSLVYHAAARGIRIEEVESRLEGEIDILGFLGLSATVRNGYQGIRVTMRVKSDAPAEKLAALCKFSPVYDTVSRPVPVTLDVHTA
jgi:uncharacterized OsmC-like protein